MFSKNIKSVPIVAMLLVTVLGSVVLYADCDMMAMLAKNGYYLSGNASTYDLFNFIRLRSTNSSPYIPYVSAYKNNDDGYGFIYYKSDGSFDYEDQSWYQVDDFPYNPGNQSFPYETFYTDDGTTGVPWAWNPVWQEALDDAEEYVINIETEATIVQGHARQGSVGEGNHPFYYVYTDPITRDTKTFTLMHNGTLTNDIKTPMYTYLHNLELLNNSNWGADPDDISKWIDSEIFFLYLMHFIECNNGNVVEGVNKALTQECLPGLPGNPNIPNSDIKNMLENPVRYYNSSVSSYTYKRVANIVLSDGANLYIFRNSPSVGTIDPDHDPFHNLSYEEDNNIVTVKTLDDLDTRVDQFDFVVISRDEDPIEYPNFLDIDIKTFASGYNWISYPRLTEQGTSGEYLYEQAYYEGGFPGMFQLTSGGDPTITDFEKILGHRLGAEDDMDIVYNEITDEFIDHDFGNMLHRHEGYKVRVATGAESTTLVIDGDRLPSNYELSEETLIANEYHWLGYWLPYSQDIDDAFGDFWQYVKIVKAENWTYADLSNPRGAGDPEPKPSMKIRPLEYGKGYLVKFTENIDDFHWNDSNDVSEPERKKTTENFAYEEKADYEVIDVLEIDPSISEIGVFEDGVCVGAVAVQDSAEQILVYSDNANRDPVPFTFEVTTGRGSSIPIKSYNSLNLRTGEYENRLIISGRQEYSVVKFGEQPEPEITINTAKLSGNYPNPFNPTTTISFSLPNEQNIELTIYNIKGQKVKTLYSGFAEVGEHTVIWKGKDNNDKQVSSGIYFYKLKTNSKEVTRKMLMMK